MTFVPSFNKVKLSCSNVSQAKSLSRVPTLTDWLRATPGAVVEAGPLG